jgi:MFS transporter, PPP family, 3-phenylpropionic acid transporter
VRIPLSLCAFWFFFGSALGVFFPFFSLYLHENAGLSAHQVGLVSAVFPLVGIAAQPIWGRVADRTGSRAGVLCAIALGSALGYAALRFASGFVPIVATTVFLALFSSASTAMAAAVTLAALGPERADAFGRARVFATIGFLTSVSLFPLALDVFQRRAAHVARSGISEPDLEVMFEVTALLSLLSALCAYRVPRGGDDMLRAERGDWRELWTQRPFVVLLGVTLLGYFFIQGPTALFPLLLSARGGGIETVSHMWILMLVVEIPLVIYTGATLRRLGPQTLVAFGIFAGGLRWALTGFFEDPRIVYPAQMLHGAAVVGMMLGSSLYVDALVPAKLRATAQGYLGMIGVSLGSVASNAAAGLAFDALSPAAPYCIGGVCAMALGLTMHRSTPARRGAQPSTVESSFTPTGQ